MSEHPSWIPEAGAVIGFFLALFAGLVGWIARVFHMRIDRKLEKDAFEAFLRQYEKDQRAIAHSQSRIEGKLDQLQARITDIWKAAATNPCAPAKR